MDFTKYSLVTNTLYDNKKIAALRNLRKMVDGAYGATKSLVEDEKGSELTATQILNIRRQRRLLGMIVNDIKTTKATIQQYRGVTPDQVVMPYSIAFSYNVRDIMYGTSVYTPVYENFVGKNTDIRILSINNLCDASGEARLTIGSQGGLFPNFTRSNEANTATMTSSGQIIALTAGESISFTFPGTYNPSINYGVYYKLVLPVTGLVESITFEDGRCVFTITSPTPNIVQIRDLMIFDITNNTIGLTNSSAKQLIADWLATSPYFTGRPDVHKLVPYDLVDTTVYNPYREPCGNYTLSDEPYAVDDINVAYATSFMYKDISGTVPICTMNTSGPSSKYLFSMVVNNGYIRLNLGRLSSPYAVDSYIEFDGDYYIAENKIYDVVLLYFRSTDTFNLYMNGYMVSEKPMPVWFSQGTGNVNIFFMRDVNSISPQSDGCMMDFTVYSNQTSTKNLSTDSDFIASILEHRKYILDHTGIYDVNATRWHDVNIWSDANYWSDGSVASGWIEPGYWNEPGYWIE